MSVLTVIAFIVGTIVLISGADIMVRGAARIAASSGLSPVVIGLTVVAFGTSAPELAVSIGAATRGTSDLALGNVVGSNIANILLVLGLSAVVGSGLVVAFRIVRIDVPIMIGASIAVIVLGLDGSLGRIDGALFVVALLAYLFRTVSSARSNADGESHHHIAKEYEEGLAAEISGTHPLWRSFALVVVGIAMLVIGSQLLVTAATDLATALGASEFLIGLTVVAVGTSLPEIATSIVAAAKGQRDLAVGNAVGSNLFNLLAVLGFTSLIAPIEVSDTALGFDLPFMLAVAVACLPIFVNGYVIKRWEGVLFTSYYVGYLVWLGLDAASASIHDEFSFAMLVFVVPLTAITLIVTSLRAARPAQTAVQ
ncbi:MAG: calcium/sodium antiporter [Ilumatobacteraceae bacterium]